MVHVDEAARRYAHERASLDLLLKGHEAAVDHEGLLRAHEVVREVVAAHLDVLDVGERYHAHAVAR